MSKLHVLVVPTWYPNGADKLMGAYHKDFCHALSQDSRMKVNMLYLDRQGVSHPLNYMRIEKRFTDKQEGYKVYGFRILDFSALSFDMEMRHYTARLISAYREYEKLEGKPQVIHAQVSVPAAYAACVLGEKIGVPVIMTEHASYYDRFFNKAEAKYNQKVMDCAMISCVGGFMQKLYTEHGIESRILPNIVECRQFNLPRPKRPAGRFQLVSVCAMREMKGIDNVISAIKLLLERIPQIHYVAIGDGDCEKIYKDHCKKLEMDDYVSFVGRKEHDEIARMFTEMDALVVASDFETFGIPAVEALAAGMPVISTRNFGTEAFLDDKCSIMCNVHDVNDLARAIIEMYEHYDDFSEDYNRSVAASYDGARVADIAYGYYRELISKKV